MRQRRNEPCPCGSGSKYKRCCGADPARHAALVDVQNAAALVPALRPVGADVLCYCGRVADELGENEGSVPDDIVAGGVDLMEDSDRAQVVSTFCATAPEVWARLAEIATTPSASSLARPFAARSATADPCHARNSS
jgi:SEC-C motif